MPDITLQPIGFVRNAVKSTDQPFPPAMISDIELNPDYLPGLTRIDDHSHLWILCWFHHANRKMLMSVPYRFNPGAPAYGVFGLRSPSRPNPIGLSLVKLEHVNHNRITVSGLDAIDGTPVLDIKPYFESDLVFSARTPGLSPVDREHQLNTLLKRALQHHGEECPGLYLGARMARLVQEKMGYLAADDLSVRVEGDGCLADVIQGLTRARVAHPPRFSWLKNDDLCSKTVWSKQKEQLILTAKQTIIQRSDYLQIPDEELLEIIEQFPVDQR